jgi:hypothetical protein
MTCVLSLLTIIPKENSYTAYFFEKDSRILLPLEIHSESVFSYLAAQQKLLFDAKLNFYEKTCVSLELSAHLYISSDALGKCGIRITKELLETVLGNNCAEDEQL